MGQKITHEMSQLESLNPLGGSFIRLVEILLTSTISGDCNF